MSEYQYYEFRAIDRPLTRREMRELRAVSTRAVITPSSFTNHYEWGDFKGDPFAWMQRYFDAFLYLANWGTHQLMLRLPRRLLDPDTAGRYCSGESASVSATREFTILSFTSEDEEADDVDDGSAWLSTLVALRTDLAAGDYRTLYLAWLLCVGSGEVARDAVEPPVPSGLRRPTSALRAFARYLRIDPNLIAVAVERSPEAEETPPRSEIAQWITTLPEAERNALLTRIATGDASHPRAEILRRFRETHPAPGHAPHALRTAAELLTAAARRADERRRRTAEQARRVRERREREEAEARERRIATLAERREEAWGQVEELITARNSPAYEEAVRLLSDLSELGRREGSANEVEERIHALRRLHARKARFVERLDRARLLSAPPPRS